MRRHFGLVTACGLIALPVAAQERPGENAAAARIAEGVEKVRAGQLLDAIEQFQRVLDTAGDDLVPVDPPHLAPARWVVHGHLSRLPPDGLRLYRQRIDGQAAKRLEEAKKGRSDVGLNRLLADMFASRAAEDAILELARRAFERGEFDAAEHFWRMLLPGDDSQLRYPNPKTATGATLARLVLVRLFQGERADALAGLALLKEKHADEAGLLAGKTGRYVETLIDLLNRPAETTLPRPPDERDWPTFAGSAARTGSTRARLPYFWPDVPAWKVKFPFLRENKTDVLPPDPSHPRALGFHPIVVQGRAYVGDGARVLSIDLDTGRFSTAAWIKDGEDIVVPTRTDLRHTLSEADGVIFARLGAAALKSGSGPLGGSFIAAFGKKPDADDREWLWRLNPPAVEGGTTHFEGTPVVRGNSLFAAYWRQAGAEAVAGVACYRLDDPKTPPDLVWQRPVGKAGAEPNGEVRYRHDLLALAGPNVVHSTHGGTVIALDASTGRPAWEYRYPRNERVTLPRYRDLCPPLVDGGRIYAAPADADRLLCLDAYTGRLIWEREGVEVVHLLGVAKGRLIATLGGQVKGIRGFNLRTGADSGDGGWTIHDDGGESTFGRGLVSDEAIVWPTRHGLHFLNPTDGTQLREPIRGTFGNLCYADGCLLVMTATEVWGYPSEARKLGTRRKAVETDPMPAKYADLAQSLIDSGDFAGAEDAIAKSGDEADRLRWFLAERLVRDLGSTAALPVYKRVVDGKSAYAPAAAFRQVEAATDQREGREMFRGVHLKGRILWDQDGIPRDAREFVEGRFGRLTDERGTGVTEDLVPGVESPTSANPIRLVREPGECYYSQSVPPWKLDPRAPRLSRLDRAAFPLASGAELRPPIHIHRGDDGSEVLRVGERAMVVRRPSGSYMTLLAPSSSTAGFQPLVGRGSGYVLAQLTNGRMIVRGPGAPVTHNYPASPRPWLEPPAHVGDDRFLIPEDDALVLFDARSGKTLARHTLSNHEAVSGELPRARVFGDHVLLIVRQNHGVEIDRLRTSDLKRSWARPVFVGRELADVSLVAERLVMTADGGLTVLDWATGERSWDAPLPETPGIGWKLAAAPVGVIAYPAEAVRTTAEPDLVGLMGPGGWFGPGLLPAVGRLYHHWATRELPVLVFDPADGRLVQRLTFPAAGPAAGVTVSPKAVCVVTGAGSWTLVNR